MPCTNPRTVYQPLEGGKAVFQEPINDDNWNQIQIPCNECLSCLNRNANEWAVRQYCESVTSRGIGIDAFLTTTYSQENLPDFGHYRYPDMQLFWKRLRSKQQYEATKRGIDPELVKIKFVTAPEYGDKTQRPHYHSNVFNLWIPDLVKAGRNQHGNPVLRSEMIEACWKKGNIDIQPFGIGSARYLANHNIKQNGGSAKAQLKRQWWAKRNRLKELQETDHPFDPVTGLILPEKMPVPRIYCSGGIGLEYYKRFQDEIYNNDFITIAGQKNPVPRYFDKKLAQDDPKRWAKVEQLREENRKEYTWEQLQTINRIKLNKKHFFSKAGKL